MFLLQVIGFFFVLCVVSNLFGCGKDAIKAGRIKFRKWLFKDDEENGA